MTVARRDRAKAVWLAGAGTVLVLAYAALAVVQILWLNPLAAVPGIPLEQIHADMAAAGESFSPWFVFVIMSVGPLAALFLFVVAVVRVDTGPLAVAVAYLVILMLGPLAYFVASFTAGMSLADTYGISGGDYSPWARPLYLVSTLALLALVGIVIAASIVARRRVAVART